MPLGSIVETNCVFSHDSVKPIVAKPLPTAVKNLVYRACVNIDTLYEGIKERDLNKIYVAFANQALCGTLTMEQSKQLFKEMCLNTREYLEEYYDLNKI